MDEKFSMKSIGGLEITEINIDINNFCRYTFTEDAVSISYSSYDEGGLIITHCYSFL